MRLGLGAGPVLRCSVGNAEGAAVATLVGLHVGMEEGAALAPANGADDGSPDGVVVGAADGAVVDAARGIKLGSRLGAVGTGDGNTLGIAVGATTGVIVEPTSDSPLPSETQKLVTQLRICPPPSGSSITHSNAFDVRADAELLLLVTGTNSSMLA